MSKDPSHCQKLIHWLSLNLPNGSLGALTGTDGYALAAASHIIQLYAYSRKESVLRAFADVVLMMQPSTREFAYHAIAHTMDWPDRALVWEAAGLPPLKTVTKLRGER